MAEKMVEVVVRAGRTVEDGKGEDRKSYGPGKVVKMSESRAKKLITKNFVAKKGSEEAKVAKTSADELPADFPGRDALIAAGITTVSALRDQKDLVAIKGIGAKTAEEIEEALAGLE